MKPYSSACLAFLALLGTAPISGCVIDTPIAFFGESADTGPAQPDVGAPSGRLFFDDLETGDLTHDENGVRWTGARESVGDSVSVGPAIVHSGTSAIRFHFASGPPVDDAWAELRFTLGQPRAELFVDFWIYFPDGSEPGENRYDHTRRDGADNNHLLRAWNTESGEVRWGASMRSGVDGASEVFGATRVGACNESAGPLPGATWQMSSADLGRWMNWRFHVRGDGGDDSGSYQFWVDGVLVVDQSDVAIPGAPCTPNHFLDGYVMGWANSGFDVDTNIYIDDVSFWE